MINCIKNLPYFNDIKKLRLKNGAKGIAFCKFFVPNVNIFIIIYIHAIQKDKKKHKIVLSTLSTKPYANKR